MIFSVPKIFLFLSLGISFAVANVPASKRYLTRFDESGLTSNSTIQGHAHSLGDIRPVKEGAATASVPAAYGHRYTPGMNRPVVAHATESTADSTPESKILAARITTIETITVTSIPLVFKTVKITRPYSQSSPAPIPLASTTVAAPEVSDLPEYRSITIILTQQPTVPPPPEILTGPPLTLPSCNSSAAASDLTPVGYTMASSVTPEPTTTYTWTDSSQGSLRHVRAATTSQPPPWTGNSTPCAGNESFECVVNGSSIIKLGPISQILATGAQPTSGAGISGIGNHSQSWTSNSAPCAQNNSFECVVEGSSTITLGLISEILGAATGNPTSGAPVSSSGNHSQNWTSQSTPCVDNKSFECIDTVSGIITLGPIASLNHLRPWTADSSPCAQSKSFECVVNGSSTITLGLIASLTASLLSTMSTNKGWLSTLSEIESLLTSFSTAASTTSTRLPNVVSMTSGTSSWGEIPQSAAPSMTGGPSPCPSNTSLECLVQGTSNFVVGTVGLPLPTPTPVSRTLVPCAQNTILSCLVDGSHTLTVSPGPSNQTISSNFPTASATQNPHDPYPYPRASNGSRKSNFPIFLVLLCSLLLIVTAQGFHGRSEGADPPKTSTSINYGPLVSSLNAIAASATGEPDGNWGIGAPSATTSTPTPTLTPYGGGTPASIATGFTAPLNPTFAGASLEKTTAAAPTHADSGSGPSSLSESLSNIIVPVTGSGTEAPVITSSQGPASSTMLITTTSAPPTPSKSPTSGSSKLKIPFFSLLLSHLASLALAVGTTTNPSPRVIIGSVFTSASASSPTSFCSCIQSKSTMASASGLLSLSESTFFSAPATSGYSATPAKSTTFTITAAQTGTTPSSGSSVSAAPSGSTPNPPTVCSSNTTLMCIVQGSNTFTVSTLQPQTTLTTTSSLVTATTGPLPSPHSPSNPAKSLAFPTFKLPFLLSFLGTLLSLINDAAAAANDFPIPSDYSGAGMKVHRQRTIQGFPIPSDYTGAGVIKHHPEITSQGLKTIATATPVLVVCFACAVATLYSLGTGRQKIKLKHEENENEKTGTGGDSGSVEYLETEIEIVPEGEKVRLFEESES